MIEKKIKPKVNLIPGESCCNCETWTDPMSCDCKRCHETVCDCKRCNE